jgi:hypothetical protein
MFSPPKIDKILLFQKKLKLNILFFLPKKNQQRQRKTFLVKTQTKPVRKKKNNLKLQHKP